MVPSQEEQNRCHVISRNLPNMLSKLNSWISILWPSDASRCFILVWQINKISHHSWIWAFLSLFYFLLALITDIWLGPPQKEIQATHFSWRPTLTFIDQLKEPMTSPFWGHCVCHGSYDSKGKSHTISTKGRMKCVILHFIDKNNVLSLDTEMVQAAQEGYYYTFQNPCALEILLNEWNLLWGPWLNDVWNIGGLEHTHYTFSYNLQRPSPNPAELELWYSFDPTSSPWIPENHPVPCKQRSFL